VRREEGELGSHVAERIARMAALRRRRIDGEVEVEHLLARVAARRQVRAVVGDSTRAE